MMNKSQEELYKINEQTVYVLYNAKNDHYYNHNGYECIFVDAQKYDDLNDVLECINEDFAGYSEDELANIEIHKVECKLSKILKRKVEYISVE